VAERSGLRGKVTDSYEVRPALGSSSHIHEFVELARVCQKFCVSGIGSVETQAVAVDIGCGIMARTESKKGRVMAQPTVRVSQLAATLREPAQQTIERLRASGVEVHSPRDTISHAEAKVLLKDVPTAADLSTARGLIIDAYAAAQESGREDWQVMTPAVLKNRLLDATDRGFNENEYGAPTFAYFVDLFPDLLTSEVIGPGIVRITIDPGALQPEAAIVHRASRPRRLRIREDLWQAFADFSSSQPYVWDEAHGVAIAGEPAAGQVAIPTLTPAEESTWRASFSAEFESGLPEHEQAALEDWRDRRLPSGTLPPRLRGAWNGYLREQMIAKIEQFFSAAQFSVPVDLLMSPSHATPRDEQRPRAQADGLRAFIHECVELMTLDELSSLALPAAAAYRARLAGSKG
jgi:hypothetical protein